VGWYNLAQDRDIWKAVANVIETLSLAYNEKYEMGIM
jgi:hypothetical protein